MPTDRPNPAELIEAVSEFLGDEVAPGLEGRSAFQMRIALNILAIVERTLANGEAMDRAELARLQALLEDDEADLGELNERLAEMIGAGDLDNPRGEVLDHLRQTAKDKLRLTNPRYLPPGDQ